MLINEAFPSKYMRCSDLNGQRRKAIIKSVEVRDLGGNNRPEDVKPVLLFDGDVTPLALNKTNAMLIAASYGQDTTDWQGKLVVMKPDKTPFQGRIVDCIRVEVPQGNAQSNELPA